MHKIKFTNSAIFKGSKRITILFLLALIAGFLPGCTCNSPKDKAPVKEVDEDSLPVVEVKIKRYEKALFTLDRNKLQEGLKKIQPEFRIFLDGDLNESENIEQIRSYLEDAAIQDHYNACNTHYPDLTWLEKELSQSFSLYSYWFPEKKLPKVYTYVSGGDFDYPVKNADSALIIALDLYLGRNYDFYASCGVPFYKARWMDKPYIARDCMEELGISVCSPEKKEGDFLDQMVNMGKLMYFLDVTMPETPDSVKIKYNGKWIDWCQKNEGNIWSFFIDNKVLYSKDRNVFLKFFSDGPFTSSFGKDSPPRIAIWVGWQIVRAYMKEVQGADIRSLLKVTDAQKILQQSKYKPKK